MLTKKTSQLFILTFLLLVVFSGAYFLYVNSKTSSQKGDEVSPLDRSGSFIEVSDEACANECISFQNENEKYQYCRAVCGFTVENGTRDLPSSQVEERNKEYDIKETAVTEKNMGKCDEIDDAQLRASCQTRVTEEIFSTQNGNGFSTEP